MVCCNSKHYLNILKYGYRRKDFFIINTLFLSKTFYHQPGLIGLYLAICSNFLFEDIFAAYWGHTLRRINQSPYLVGVGYKIPSAEVLGKNNSARTPTGAGLRRQLQLPVSFIRTPTGARLRT